MSTRFDAVRPWLPALAGVSIVLGEHIWRAEPVRPYLSGAAGLLVLGALVWNTALMRGAERGGSAGSGSAAPSQGAGGGLIWPPALFALAGALYLASLWAPESLSAPDWAGILDWGWALTTVAGAVLYVFIEIAWLSQSGAARPEGQRLRLARDAGAALALLLLVIIALNFTFDRLALQWDLGYFHTALPSDATVETVRNLDAPVSVAVFFPQGNPVLGLVRDYFADLEGVSPHFQVAFYDADLNPEEAKQHKARKNGIIQVSRESVTRDLSLGLTLEAAGSKLVKLDSNFLEKLAEVARPKRIAYFTVGHGERNEKDTTLPTTSRVKGLESILRAQNFTVKSLGLSEGLGTDVPQDAQIVLVAGPQFPFRPEEETALERYIQRGGRVLLFLEPDAGSTPGLALPPSKEAPPLSKLLERHGVNFVAAVQANDRIYGRRTQTKADFALLATNRYQSHPTVNSLRRNSQQFPLLFLGTGAFTRGTVASDLASSDLIMKETIKGMAGTWSDADRNFNFDDGKEKRGEPILAVAISPKAAPKPKVGDKADPAAELALGAAPEPRIVAFADADVASDLFIQNRANQLALLDGIAWLAGDASPAAAPTEEEDLKIQHLKGDELIWFYLPVFGVPALVLLVGFALARRSGALARRGSHG